MPVKAQFTPKLTFFTRGEFYNFKCKENVGCREFCMSESVG